MIPVKDNFFFQKHYREVFFSELDQHDVEFKFILRDILSYERSSFSHGNTNYMVFFAEALESYDFLGLMQNQQFKLHLPEPTLRMTVGHKIRGLDLQHIYDMVIHFKRMSRKRVRVTYFEIMDCGERGNVRTISDAIDEEHVFEEVDSDEPKDTMDNQEE